MVINNWAQKAKTLRTKMLFLGKERSSLVCLSLSFILSHCFSVCFLHFLFLSTITVLSCTHSSCLSLFVHKHLCSSLYVFYLCVSPLPSFQVFFAVFVSAIFVFVWMVQVFLVNRRCGRRSTINPSVT